VKLALIFLSAALGSLVYWVARQLPLPPEPVPPRRPSLLDPLEHLLQRELDRAGFRLPGRVLLYAMLVCGCLGALVAWPLGSGPLQALVGAACAGLPLLTVRVPVRRRTRQIQAAVAPALNHIARLCEVRRDPHLALADALPLLAPPLKGELALALTQARADVPLPEALRHMAARCDNNFYLHQLADLVALCLRDGGGDLSAGLDRLLARFRSLEGVRARQQRRLIARAWLTGLLAMAPLLGLTYWAPTLSPTLQFHLLSVAAIFLVAASAGLAVYGLLQKLPPFSPRHQMVRRLGAAPAGRPRLIARRRQALLAENYPDLISHLAARTRAGAGLLEALATSPAILREPLRSDVEDLIADLRLSPASAALERFARRCGLPQMRSFIQTVISQQALGIPLAEIVAAEEIRALAMARQSARA